MRCLIHLLLEVLVHALNLWIKLKESVVDCCPLFLVLGNLFLGQTIGTHAVDQTQIDCLGLLTFFD